jgi:hypothetical protein
MEAQYDPENNDDALRQEYNPQGREVQIDIDVGTRLTSKDNPPKRFG